MRRWPARSVPPPSVSFSLRISWRQLRAAGVRLQRFHRWSWRQPMRYNRRDHRKLLVIDGKTAYLGGFNIHREGSRRYYGPKRWRDVHVCFEGPLAAEADALFDAFWCGHPDWSPQSHTIGDSRIIPNTTRTCRVQLRCAIKEQLAGASDKIWLATPYFVPDRGLRKLLVLAARRGGRCADPDHRKDRLDPRTMGGPRHLRRTVGTRRSHIRVHAPANAFQSAAR